MATRFTLHGFWLSGPTYKVGLFLSLAGIACDFQQVNLRGGEHKSPDYKAKHRYGQIPLLVDHEAGRNLVQSAAILEYLADETGRFGGNDADERIAAREWMYWEFDRLARGVFRPRGARAGFVQLAPEVVEHYVAEGIAAFKTLDDHLAGRDWLVGSGLTIADIDVYGVIAYADQAGHDLAPFPNLTAWKQRLEALPGFLGCNDCLPQETRAAA